MGFTRNIGDRISVSAVNCKLGELVVHIRIETPYLTKTFHFNPTA